MRRIVLVGTLIMAVSCMMGQHNEESAEKILRPLSETREVCDIGNHVKEVSFKRMPENVLMSDVMKLLVHENGDVIIQDMASQLLLLKESADSLEVIANRGRASNEYLVPRDIALSGENLLLLDDTEIRSFGLYEKLSCKSFDVPVNVPCDAIAPCSGDGVYLFSAFPLKFKDSRKENDYLLYSADLDEKKVRKFIRREDCTFTIGNISQSSGNRYYLRPQNSRHIFYELTESGPVPSYKIDFGKKNIPDRYYYSTAGEDVGRYMVAAYYKLPMGLCRTDTHLYFHCCGPDASDVNYIYDEETGRGINWISGPMDHTARILAATEEEFLVLYQNLEGGLPEVGALANFIRKEYLKLGFDDENAQYIVRVRFGKIN